MIGRVADDDDIVIDDLQADLAHLLDKEDDENGVKVKFILLKLNFKKRDIETSVNLHTLCRVRKPL